MCSCTCCSSSFRRFFFSTVLPSRLSLLHLSTPLLLCLSSVLAFSCVVFLLRFALSHEVAKSIVIVSFFSGLVCVLGPTFFFLCSPLPLRLCLLLSFFFLFPRLIFSSDLLYRVVCWSAHLYACSRVCVCLSLSPAFCCFALSSLLDLPTLRHIFFLLLAAVPLLISQQKKWKSFLSQHMRLLYTCVWQCASEREK